MRARSNWFRSKYQALEHSTTHTVTHGAAFPKIASTQLRHASTKLRRIRGDDLPPLYLNCELVIVLVSRWLVSRVFLLRVLLMKVISPLSRLLVLRVVSVH